MGEWRSLGRQGRLGKGMRFGLLDYFDRQCHASQVHEILIFELEKSCPKRVVLVKSSSGISFS